MFCMELPDLLIGQTLSIIKLSPFFIAVHMAILFHINRKPYINMHVVSIYIVCIHCIDTIYILIYI